MKRGTKSYLSSRSSNNKTKKKNSFWCYDLVKYCSQRTGNCCLKRYLNNFIGECIFEIQCLGNQWRGGPDLLHQARAATVKPRRRTASDNTIYEYSHIENIECLIYIQKSRQNSYSHLCWDTEPDLKTIVDRMLRVGITNWIVRITKIL